MPNRCARALPRLLLPVLFALVAASTPAAEPVATVRVAFDRAGVTATQATGLADIAAQRAVTADDPVRIASISKLVLAIGLMRLVEQGQRITSGQKIGLVGKTGRSTGAHLHYEVRHKGKAIDPMRFIQVAQQSKALKKRAQ